MKALSFILTMTLSIATLETSLSAQAGNLPNRQVIENAKNKEKAKNSREVVFIHGMFMTPLCWDGWMSSFAQSGYRVSAPAWPLHEGSVEELRDPSKLEALGQLSFFSVLNHYRVILRQKQVKPVLIGHSMGGLIAQILLSEGLGQAAIAIDSAAPKGVFVTNASFVKSNSGVFNIFADADAPIEMDLAKFSYAFTNAQTPEVQKQAYEHYYVPESRHVGRGPLTRHAKIDYEKARGPLLLIAGEVDHIIPANLNYKNFLKYKETPANTAFVLLKGRDHTTIVSPGWEDVAETAKKFLQQQLAD